jgi:hypothetical protein
MFILLLMLKYIFSYDITRIYNKDFCDYFSFFNLSDGKY